MVLCFCVSSFLQVHVRAIPDIIHIQIREPEDVRSLQTDLYCILQRFVYLTQTTAILKYFSNFWNIFFELLLYEIFDVLKMQNLINK